MMSTHNECVPDSVAGAATIADAKIEALRTSVHQISGGNQTWSWKRPKWHGTSSRVTTYSKRATIDEIFGSIKKDAECIFEHFDRSCFGAYRRVAKGGSLCSQAFHFVMSMEITLSNALNDEMWFRIGDVNIRFSKLEFALVTGLRFGNASFDPTAIHTPPSSGIHQRLFNGRDTTVKDIFMEFTQWGFEGCSLLDRVKIVKILFLYYQLMGVDHRGKKVDKWVWTLVEDDAAWDAFPWGLYSYQFLLQHLKAVCVDEEIRYYAYGNISAFLCWAYEAIPPLAAVCAERLLLSSTQIPRALRWKFQSLKFECLKLESLKFDEFPCLPMLEITPEEEKHYQDWWPAVHIQNMSATSLLRRRLKKKKKKKAEKESDNAVANKPGDETRVDMLTRKRVSSRENSEEEIRQGLSGNEATLPDNPAFEILCNSERRIRAAERTQHAVSLDKHGLETLNPVKIEQGICLEKVLSLEKEIDALNQVINKLNTKQSESDHREEKLRECHAEAEKGLNELRVRVSDFEIERKFSGSIMELLRRKKLEADVMLKESEWRSSEKILGLEKEIDLLKRRECLENSNRGHKRKRSGVFGADVVRAFHEDDELCIQAVFEFYSHASDSEFSNRRFYHFEKFWQHELADYLIQGDSEVPRPIAEVKRRFPHVVDLCRQLAIEYSSYFIAMPRTLSVSLVCRHCYMLTDTHELCARETCEDT